ncbi:MULTISPECIES: glycerate kinase [unclassified Sporolactobacillus]|uniref:glycerate kinase n=1 Tax=unclassified Sporolactobacillus TaxID=2628533 RepID=UPI0023675A66|nr:glycerate kinase [Sporolactobacillus sp. CQH2019]MDD9147775.1 glycerate kinase [Sporolactobacillus sp. CQH2019]
MRALIAIDSFKESFTSMEAAELVEKAFSQYGIKSRKIAIADGGEGTVAAFLHNKPGGELIKASVHNPFGIEITAEFAWYAKEKTAIIEVAAASGICFISKRPDLTPLETSSYGTGELIAQAVGMGAKRIIVGLGGSGTIDGGMGLLGALDARFFDPNGNQLDPVVRNLSRVSKIDLTHLITKNITLISATDVDNPLTGKTGAVHMFGPQKGLSDANTAVMEQLLLIYSKHLDPLHSGMYPGDGAAGGIGFALRMIGGQVENGFAVLAIESELDKLIQDTDLVVTGEGRLDEQSLHGKVPIAVAQLAKKADKKCIAFVGQQQGESAAFQKAGLTSVFPITDSITNIDQAMREGKINLFRCASRVGARLKIDAAFS